jgi:predicted TIM-barrel fold metal-dependent hydrolase
MADRHATDILGMRHSKPKIALPKGATDCHVHVFGPQSRYPYAEDRVYTPPDASISDLVRLHEHIGVERVVIVHPSPYGTDNRVSLDAATWLGEKARVVAVIPATLDEDELEALDVLGVRGVRLNLATAGVKDPETIWQVVKALAPKLADNGWHLQMFTSLDVIDQLADRLATLPITIVFDHFGGAQAIKGAGQPGFRTLTDLLKSGQAYVKISAGYRVSSKPDQSDVTALAEVLISANPDRVVWGTDWPHPGARHGLRPITVTEPFQQIDDGAAVDRLAGWAGSAERLYRILVTNPARLYGF